MNTEDALSVVSEACAAFVGNLEVHRKIQEALMVVYNAVSQPPPTPPDEEMGDSPVDEPNAEVQKSES